MSLPRLHPDDLQEICTHISIELLSKLENLISKKDKTSELQTLTVWDVAKILNQNPTTILRYINSPKKLLKANKIGKDWIITQKSLENYINGK